jgi:SAM-dependent methyltransferase
VDKVEAPEMANHSLPATNPTVLFRRRDGIYASDLLVTAIGWLDFFNWLAEHPSDRAVICASLQIAARPADVMLTLFTAMGLLKSKDGMYTLTDLAEEHLVNRSPWDLGPYFSSLKERPICQDILEALKTDKPFGWASRQDEDEWAMAMEREDFAETFTAAMDSRGAYLAPLMAKVLDCRNHRRLLDIAGGSGIYACAVVSEYPHLEAAVLEKPPVDRVAYAAISKRGLTERVSVIAGDMFNDVLPPDFDVHLYSHVLHDWNERTVQTLLQKSFEALPPGGLVAIHDAHLQADKTGPLAVAEYSVLLMLSTPGKCYSVGEMQSMLEAIGFTEVKYLPTTADRSLILARKPDPIH